MYKLLKKGKSWLMRMKKILVTHLYVTEPNHKGIRHLVVTDDYNKILGLVPDAILYGMLEGAPNTLFTANSRKVWITTRKEGKLQGSLGEIFAVNREWVLNHLNVTSDRTVSGYIDQIETIENSGGR